MLLVLYSLLFNDWFDLRDDFIPERCQVAIRLISHLLVMLRGAHTIFFAMLAELEPGFLWHFGHDRKVLQTQQLDIKFGGFDLESDVDVFESELEH